jgi:hypothetical protein
MRSTIRIVLAVMACFGIAAAAWGQRMGQPPTMYGEFKPVVGTGAQYEATMKGQKFLWTYAVVGKETVQGQEGNWLEMRMEGGPQGTVIMKHLIVMQDGKAEIKRMITQAGGQPPMEMPMGMMNMMKGKGKSSSEGMGEKVGTEPMIVPAGTFLCDHYHKSGAANVDFWVSSKIPPYGMVKMVSGEMNMVLVKVLSNETSQIKGEPQKMPGMGGMMPKGEWSDEK